MAGNKNSGRRITSDREKRQRVIDKSWDILEEALNNKKVSLKQKIAIAEKIAVKSMPQALAMTGSVTINYGHRAK